MFDLHPAPQLVLQGNGWVFLGQQPPVLEDQIHEPRKCEAVVLFLEPEAIMVDLGRVVMNVGVIQGSFGAPANSRCSRLRAMELRPLNWEFVEPGKGRPAAAAESVRPEPERGSGAGVLASNPRGLTARRGTGGLSRTRLDALPEGPGFWSPRSPGAGSWPRSIRGGRVLATMSWGAEFTLAHPWARSSMAPSSTAAIGHRPCQLEPLWEEAYQSRYWRG